MADWLVWTSKTLFHNYHCFCWFALRFQEITMQKHSSFPRASSENLLLNKKTKETWHFLLVVQTDTSFIIHIIMLISYCCFVCSTGCIRVCFVVTPILSVDSRYCPLILFPVCFSTSFKSKTSIKKPVLSKLLEVTD